MSEPGWLARGRTWVWAFVLAAGPGCQVLFGVDLPEETGGAGAGGDPSGGAGLGISGSGGGGRAGTSSGSGGVGGAAGGTGGAAGTGEAGTAGGEASGMAGTAGGGGGAAGCDAAKGEFEVSGEAGSCFFLLAGDAKVQPPSGRTKWMWDEARDDCTAFGSTTKLASLVSLGVYQQVRDYLVANGEALAGLTLGTLDENVWIGGATGLSKAVSSNELAASFTWVSGEAWAFTTASQPPWGGQAEPSIDGLGDDVTERCVEMRNTYDFNMNNILCEEQHYFALCRRTP